MTPEMNANMAIAKQMSPGCFGVVSFEAYWWKRGWGVNYTAPAERLR